MESIKAVVEEVKCISGYSHIVPPNSENSFCGGCCEGTVFTFTSAASNGRLRQRLRCRAPTLKPNGRREEVTDTVISELRIMPPSQETTSADGEIPYLSYDFMSTQFEGARKSNGVNSVCETKQGLAQNPVDYKQLARRIGREKSGEISKLSEESVAPLKQPESLTDDLHGLTFLRGERYDPLHRNGEASSEEGCRREENQDSIGASIDQQDSKGRIKVQFAEPFLIDRKDERNHKRYSCPEEVNNFERRKLRCGDQREEERFTSRTESVRSELGGKVRQRQAKRTELRMVEFTESEGKLEIEAELRNLQARQHVTGLKLNMRRKGQARLSEQAYDVLTDSGVSSQTTMEVDEKKEYHLKENGRFATSFESFAAERLGHVSPSKGPLACSFISFKGGISGLQGKTFSFGGETFTRAESSAQTSERTATGTTTFSSANNFSYEALGATGMEERHLVEEMSRTQSGLAFGRISPCTADTEIQTSKGGEEVTAINPDVIVPLEIEGLGDRSFVTQDATWKGMSQRSIVQFSNRETLTPSSTSHKLSSDLPHSFSRKVNDRGRESKTNGSFCEEQESRWSAVLRKSVGGRFRDDNGNGTERRLQESRQKRPAVDDRLASISLDWYGSPRSEDRSDADCINNDVRYLQSQREGADCSSGSTACPADAREIEDGTPRLKDACQIMVSEGSNWEVELQDDTPGTPEFHDNPTCEKTLRIVQGEREKQEESGVRSEACYLKSHRSQQERTCDSAYYQQDEPSIRRHAWSRSFKKKSVQRVSYFEKWLGTGKRKALLKKRSSKFGGTRNGVKNVDKPRPPAEEMLDTLPSYSMGELHVKSPASLRSGYGTSHVRKGFAALEAIVELRGRTCGSDCPNSLRGGNNASDIFVSSAIVQPESFKCGCQVLSFQKSQTSGAEEAGESQNLEKKEPLNFPGATAKANLAEQHAVGDEKYRNATKVSTGEVETADLPTSTNITVCRDIEKAKGRHFSPRSLSDDDSPNLAEKKYEVKLSGKEHKSFGAEELSDCVDVRSSGGHQERIQQGNNGLLPVEQALDGSERYGFSLQKSASDYQWIEDWSKGDAADATEARTSPIPVEESRNSSLLMPRCSVEAGEEMLVRGLSQTAQHNACSRNGSEQSSGISTLRKEFAKERLRMDCADSALVKAGNHESLERSQESPTDDIPKPVIIRKPKTPIVIRVRNGLANGWLLQSFIWKKFGKHKSKAVELQSPTSTDVSRKGNADPLSTSSAGLANTHAVGALAASLSSGPRGWKDKCGDPLDHFTSRGEKTPRVRQKVFEGVATSKPFSGESITSATVRVTLTGSADFLVDDDVKNTTSLSSCSTHVSAFEDYVDGGEKAEQKILAECRSLAFFEARETCLRASDAGVEGANLRQKDLQQQVVLCEGHDSQASETHILQRVGEDKFLQEGGILSAESAKVPIAVQGEHQCSPSVDSAAVAVFNRGSGVSEASPECELGVTLVNFSNEDASPPCTGATEVTRISEEVSQSFPAKERHRDTKHNIGNSVDQSLGRVRGRSTRSVSVQKSRGELSSKCGKCSPVRGHSADAHGEDVLCSVTLDPLISGEAPTLSLLSDVEFREGDPYKRLLRLLPTTTATKDLPTSSQGNKDVHTSEGSSSFRKCNDLPPAIHSSENALSSSLRDISVPIKSKDRASCPGDKRSKLSTPRREDKTLTKSSGRCGPAGISQPPDTETCSNGGTKVSESISSHTDSRRRLTLLDVRNAFHVLETVEAPERYDNSGLTWQRDRLEYEILNSELVPSSPKRHEANNTDPGMVEEATSTVSCKTSRISEKRIDGREREEGAKNQTKPASDVCQSDNLNRSDSRTPGRSALSAVTRIAQPSGHENSDVRAVQGPDRAGSRLPQDQQHISWYGPTAQNGNANMEGITDVAELPAVQGFWLPRSSEWNRTDTRESHAATLSLDQLDTCTYRSLNRFVDPIPWNEVQRSSTAPTLETPLNRLRVENSEVFQPRQVWNFPSSSEPQVPNHHVLKDERPRSSFTDGHTQDEVFLERFSSSKDSQNNKTQHRRKSSIDFSLLASGSLRAPIVPATTSVGDESSSFSSQDKVVLARENSLSFTRKVDPAVPRTPNSLFASPCAEPSASHPNEMIHPPPSNIEDFQQPLPYVAEPDLPKSNMIPNQAYRTYETGLLPDFGNSFSTVSPCSSRTGYSEDACGKLSLKPKLCLHGSIGYDPGVAWGHYSEEALEVKAIPAQSCIQARPVHLPPSLVHNPTLTRNHQTFRAGCHAAQPFCDPCNYSSCCSTGSNGFAICGSMFPESQYHYGPEHTLGHPVPAYISPRPIETAIPQHKRITVSHGYAGQYAPKATVGRYAPPQTMSTRQSSWPVSDKVASSASGDTSLPDCDSELKKEQDSGLIWLTGEEMNIIRELRQSVGKESTRASDCLADPEPSPLMSFSSTATGARESSLYAGGSNISHASSISRCSNYSSCTSPRKAHEAGTTTHTELTRDSLLKRWITSMQKAASIIQRAWRALLRRRREKVPSVKALPKNMKDFFELIKTRQSCKNFRPPSFDDFVRSVKYIQARTEGARVRRRLKSRRLQAIIMEIKEIRNLLSEMSEEGNRDASAPYLYPQLCSQLQQKILQFHTALTGPQMQARFLLRRGPATPLVLYPSKSPAPGAINVAASHKLGEQHHPRMLTVFPDSKPLQTRHVTSRRHGSKGKLRPSTVKSQVSLTDPPESAKLLPWYFLAQRSPSGPITGRSSPTEFTSTSHGSRIIKKESQETVLDSSSPQTVNKRMLPYERVPLKTDAVDSTINEVYEEQPVTLMQRRKTSDLSFDDIPIGTANAGMFSVDFGPTAELLNKPKRPFLKRKSIVMAPQKLDWSKVKPMVSSRLEPELKTKLSYCRHTKAVDRPAAASISRRRKENYSQVKSRLFNYEENLSPSSSKGNTSRVRQSEQDDAETSPRSRGGSFVEGTSESGESSRLADYIRPASPDLLRLKSQVQADTEAELAYRRAKASITESQIEPTYSSRFDSVRYLHKLENSEQTAKDSSRQSAQPRTQRIRLRLIPGSEENEPGKVLVQKIENQEEDIPDLWHDQRIAMRNRRRQSHSHRYASYRESSQVDAQPSSELDESGRPGSPQDRRTIKAFGSSKMGLASKELEEMFERVIAAKCGSTSNLYKSQLGGRNITLSDLFEQTKNAEVKTTRTQRFPWTDRQR